MQRKGGVASPPGHTGALPHRTRSPALRNLRDGRIPVALSVWKSCRRLGAMPRRARFALRVAPLRQRPTKSFTIQS